MSNVCFNLGQNCDEAKTLHPHDLWSMHNLRLAWDAIKRAEPPK